MPRWSQGNCKGRDTWGDNTLLLLVDAKSSPQTLNNGVSADLNDDVWGGTHVPGEQEDLASP